MLKKSKKAFVETQFNWIFIIIAGGIILLFFFSVVNKQKTVSDIKITGTIRADLRAILTGSKVSTGTASLIEISGLKIEYDCLGYSIGVFEPIRPHEGFSPSLIKGRNLMVWALDWNAPFRVTNFLYLTSPEIRYIIVDDADASSYYAEQLNESLPQRGIESKESKIVINKEFVEESELGSIQDKNDYKVRFVFFGSSLSSSGLSGLGNMKDEDVTAVLVGPETTDIDGYGTLKFYEKEGNSWDGSGSTYYLGKASLIGAVFTDKIETYNCNMRKAFEDLSIASDVYIKRTNALVSFYETGSPDLSCQTQLGLSTNSISQDKPMDRIKSISSVLSESFPLSLSNIADEIAKLTAINEKAQKLSCEVIY